MSLQNVKDFYEKLAEDEEFCNTIRTAGSKDRCRQIVKQAGFDFTIEEFEEYTAKFVIPQASDDSLNQLDDRELSAVVGGFMSIDVLPPYGHSPHLWRNSFK